MTVTIVQAARGSEPYRWRGVPDELRENGAEPEAQLFGAALLDASVSYPGLPTLTGITPSLDGAEPVARLVGVAEDSSDWI